MSRAAAGSTPERPASPAPARRQQRLRRDRPVDPRRDPFSFPSAALAAPAYFSFSCRAPPRMRRPTRRRLSSRHSHHSPSSFANLGDLAVPGSVFRSALGPTSRLDAVSPPDPGSQASMSARRPVVPVLSRRPPDDLRRGPPRVATRGSWSISADGAQVRSSGPSRPACAPFPSGAGG